MDTLDTLVEMLLLVAEARVEVAPSPVDLLPLVDLRDPPREDPRARPNPREDLRARPNPRVDPRDHPNPREDPSLASPKEVLPPYAPSPREVTQPTIPVTLLSMCHVHALSPRDHPSRRVDLASPRDHPSLEDPSLASPRDHPSREAPSLASPRDHPSREAPNLEAPSQVEETTLLPSLLVRGALMDTDVTCNGAVMDTRVETLLLVAEARVEVVPSLEAPSRVDLLPLEVPSLEVPSLAYILPQEDPSLEDPSPALTRDPHLREVSLSPRDLREVLLPLETACAP
jgi:hypothetical protein